MINVLHPWHGADYGNKAPQIVNGLIEIPQGSRAKYEVDKKTGLLKLDRVIYSSFHYPINYGFIPQTLGKDGDALDILVMCSQKFIVKCSNSLNYLMIAGRIECCCFYINNIMQIVNGSVTQSCV